MRTHDLPLKSPDRLPKEGREATANETQANTGSLTEQRCTVTQQQDNCFIKKHTDSYTDVRAAAGQSLTR